MQANSSTSNQDNDVLLQSGELNANKRRTVAKLTEIWKIDMADNTTANIKNDIRNTKQETETTKVFKKIEAQI